MKLKPNFSPAYNNLGVALKSLNKLDEALVTSKKAVELTKHIRLVVPASLTFLEKDIKNMELNKIMEIQ